MLFQEKTEEKLILWQFKCLVLTTLFFKVPISIYSFNSWLFTNFLTQLSEETLAEKWILEGKNFNVCDAHNFDQMATLE